MLSQPLLPQTQPSATASSGGAVPPEVQATESQPLLPRTARAPVLARCLLRVSERQLNACLFACFLVHLARVDEFWPWARLVQLTLSADCFWLLIVLLGLLAGEGWATCLAAQTVQTLGLGCGIFAAAAVAALHAMLVWYAMLKVCLLHGLLLRCIVPPACTFGKQGAPGISFLRCWAWLPLGLFVTVANALWRPWYVAFYVLPVGLFGHGPLLSMTWWKWREALVGGAFWSCLIFVGLAASSRAFLSAEIADRRFLLYVGTALCLVCTLGMYYLTVPPVVDFWLFLGHPWLEVGRSLWLARLPSLMGEEWIAMFATAWFVSRLLYIGTNAQLEQWTARQRMEDTLQNALAHPFRAELEQGFGGRFKQGEDLGSSRPSERTRGLKEKHKALIEARKNLLLKQAGGRAALPGHLRLSVSRERILEDTIAVLFEHPVSELLAPKVLVKFDGEKGVDAGGLTRDWFDSVGRALAEHAPDPHSGALLATAPDQTLIPRSVGSDEGDVPLEQQEKFRALLALGRFMALVVFHEHPSPVSFSLILCKYLLRVPVGMSDVRQLDPEFFNGRVAQVLKENGIAETNEALGEALTFVSAATDVCPEPQELKPGGARLAVTEENKTEYVQLLCEAYLTSGIRREIQCLLQGFWDVLPPEVLEESGVAPRELSVLMSGVAQLDPEEWRRHSNGSGTMVHQWFWEIVQEMGQEQRCMLLHFTTGSSRLPPGGFPDMRPAFTVTVTSSGSAHHLPHAHTCTNQIVLHRYASKEQLQEKLLPALLVEDFGFC